MRCDGRTLHLEGAVTMDTVPALAARRVSGPPRSRSWPLAEAGSFTSNIATPGAFFFHASSSKLATGRYCARARGSAGRGVATGRR